VQIRVVTDHPWEVPADLLVVPFVGSPSFTGVLDALDTRTGGELRALEAFGEIRRKRYSSALAAPGETRARRILMVSAGHQDELDREAARHVGATAIRRLLNRHATSVAIWLAPLTEALDLGEAEVADQVIRGAVEGGFEPKTIYRDDSDSVPPEIEELVLIASAADVPAVQRAAERGRIIGEGSNMARRLANRAANDVTPQVLADEASEIAAAHGLWIDIIDETRAAELGMGLFLAVGKGSDNPPRMIVMRAGEAGAKDNVGRHLALVGKGVCFDSGGISIKPSDRMEEMKMDKTGACTVIAAIATAARLAPGLPLLAVAPAVENMPGGHATRPGDIVRALNGKFVDITNTDAEGRLILADAMTYAEQLGATHIADVATLTGAVGRALGTLVTGAFATPDKWWHEVAAAAHRAGERYWRIPLVKDYEHEMDSWYGDLQNSGSSDGSLVKSGLFLEQFRTVPWAHLDIGGTAYFRTKHPFAAQGATGVTLGTLVELALAGA
jgi:leucyl aminopeptidase